MKSNRFVLMVCLLIAIFTAVAPVAVGEPSAANTCPGGTTLGPSILVTVSGVASGAGWAWCITGPGYSVCDSNVTGLPSGASAAQIAQAISASITAAGCPGLVSQVEGDSSFTIASSCLKDFFFCIGAANSVDLCCVSAEAPGVCTVDAEFSQIFQYENGLNCGDVDFNFIITISDVVLLINYIFTGGHIPLLVSANADGDCFVSISDAVYLINYIFAGGPAPGNCW